MSKQDRQVVRRAEELERKYKLGAIGDTAREIARQSQALSGINATVDGLNYSVQMQGQTVNQRIETLTQQTNTNTQDITDLKEKKMSKDGWNADKYLGTDVEGKVIEKDGPKSISLLDVYPVGSIYMSTRDTNPGTLFGGTWERYAQGRVLVGLDEGDADFGELGKTGGEKTNTHKHDTNFSFDGTEFFARATNDNNTSTIDESVARGVITPTATGEGRARRDSTWDAEVSLLQPYITCYMWRRTT